MVQVSKLNKESVVAKELEIMLTAASQLCTMATMYFDQDLPEDLIVCIKALIDAITEVHYQIICGEFES